jgi:hypothetical protein
MNCTASPFRLPRIPASAGGIYGAEFGEDAEELNLSGKKQLILKFENCIVKETLL